MTTVRQLSFSGGELTPSLHARIDLTKYETGLKTCRNFMIKRQGGATNRPGTKFVAEVKDSSKTGRLIPFVFNVDQTYVLEFGDQYIRVIKDGAQVLEAAQVITGVTQAVPCVVTIAGHPFLDTEEVFITGVEGMTELNNRNFKLANVTANTFELQEMDGTNLDATGFTAYTSAGTAARVYTVATPYLEADLPELRYIQSADLVTLTHPSYAPRELARTSDTSWALSRIVFGPSIDPPTGLAISGGSGAFEYTVTAVDAITGEESFAAALMNSAVTTNTLTWDRVDGAGSYNIYRHRDGLSGWLGRAGQDASPSFVNSNFTPDYLDNPPDDRQPFLGLEEPFTISGATQADPCVITTSAAHGYSSTEEVYINGVGGMVELNVGVYLVTVLSGTTFSLQDLDGVDIDSTGFTAYVSGGNVHRATETDNQPSTCAYYQQRLIFANTINDPEGVWMSRSTLPKSMLISTPLQDDDSVVFSLFGTEVNEVNHIMDLDDLVLFTTSSEMVVRGDSAGVITPTAINPGEISAEGAGILPPVKVGGTALFVQAGGGTVRDLGFDFESDGGNQGKEVSIFGAHLLEGYTIVDWAYQKLPNSIVWAVRSDGTLLGLTYVREQEISAWHRHDFTGGAVENITTVPRGTESDVYVVVKRTVNGKVVRYIEQMQRRLITDIVDAIFMDSALSYDGRNEDTGHSMTLSGGTTWDYDDDLTLTSSASFFAASDIGNGIFLYDSDGNFVNAVIRAYTSPTVVTVRSKEGIVPESMRNTALAVWTKAVIEVGGLWHLEGEEINALVDGFVSADANDDDYGAKTVTDGKISFDDPHGVIHVGMPIVADLQMLPIDQLQGKSLTDKKKQVGKLTIHVESTRGLTAGPDGDDRDQFKMRNLEGYDEPIDLKTGVVEQNITSQWSQDGDILIRQTAPLPITVLAVVPGGFIAS